MSKDIVQRVWREADLRPHRLARYMASNDPDFETKAADIIGLYLDPPRHAAVFCIDEKTAIQALDRRDRVLPLSPGRVERHGFEYKRHGTLSLYAALNVRTGEVQGKTTARHTSPDFVDFLGEVVATRALDEEIHVILDNLSTRKTKLVKAFLDEPPNVTLHFTPTYSSWLNQVELWFSKVQRDVLSRVGALVKSNESDLGSTTRCCGLRWHRQTTSVRVCSPSSRRLATLGPRFAGLTALTMAPRTLVRTGSCLSMPNPRPQDVAFDDLFRVVQFRMTVDIAGHLHVDGGLGAEAAAVHRRLLEVREALPLEVREFHAVHHPWKP